MNSEKLEISLEGILQELALEYVEQDGEDREIARMIASDDLRGMWKDGDLASYDEDLEDVEISEDELEKTLAVLNR